MRRVFIVVAVSVLVASLLITGCATTKSVVTPVQPIQTIQKPKTEELKVGVFEDNEYWYSGAWAKSKDLQLALDAAAHDAKVELAKYLTNNSQSPVYHFTEIRRIKQDVKKGAVHYKGYVLLRAPKDKNPKLGF